MYDFNPCFVGLGVATKKMKTSDVLRLLDFNPCFVGLGVATPKLARRCGSTGNISILVLLDWVLQPIGFVSNTAGAFLFQSLFCWIGCCNL